MKKCKSLFSLKKKSILNSQETAESPQSAVTIESFSA